jgi:putative transposase
MHRVQQTHPFHLLAYAVLPDRLHGLMQCAANTTYSEAMPSIKRNFALNYKAAGGIETPSTVWQPRFWDHVIRDENDLQRHMSYIHYNPVKHGLSTRLEEWPCSSFRFWLDRGYYEVGWGWTEPDNMEGVGSE